MSKKLFSVGSLVDSSDGRAQSTSNASPAAPTTNFSHPDRLLSASSRLSEGAGRWVRNGTRMVFASFALTGVALTGIAAPSEALPPGSGDDPGGSSYDPDRDEPDEEEPEEKSGGDERAAEAATRAARDAQDRFDAPSPPAPEPRNQVGTGDHHPDPAEPEYANSSQADEQVTYTESEVQADDDVRPDQSDRDAEDGHDSQDDYKDQADGEVQSDNEAQPDHDSQGDDKDQADGEVQSDNEAQPDHDSQDEADPEPDQNAHVELYAQVERDRMAAQEAQNRFAAPPIDESGSVTEAKTTLDPPTSEWSFSGGYADSFGNVFGSADRAAASDLDTAAKAQKALDAQMVDRRIVSDSETTTIDVPIDRSWPGQAVSVDIELSGTALDGVESETDVELIDSETEVENEVEEVENEVENEVNIEQVVGPVKIAADDELSTRLATLAERLPESDDPELFETELESFFRALQSGSPYITPVSKPASPASSGQTTDPFDGARNSFAGLNANEGGRSAGLNGFGATAELPAPISPNAPTVERALDFGLLEKGPAVGANENLIGEISAESLGFEFTPTVTWTVASGDEDLEKLGPPDAGEVESAIIIIPSEYANNTIKEIETGLEKLASGDVYAAQRALSLGESSLDGIEYLATAAEKQNVEFVLETLRQELEPHPNYYEQIKDHLWSAAAASRTNDIHGLMEAQRHIEEANRLHQNYPVGAANSALDAISAKLDQIETRRQDHVAGLLEEAAKANENGDISAAEQHARQAQELQASSLVAGDGNDDQSPGADELDVGQPNVPAEQGTNYELEVEMDGLEFDLDVFRVEETLALIQEAQDLVAKGEVALLFGNPDHAMKLAEQSLEVRSQGIRLHGGPDDGLTHTELLDPDSEYHASLFRLVSAAGGDAAKLAKSHSDRAGAKLTKEAPVKPDQIPAAPEPSERPAPASKTEQSSNAIYEFTEYNSVRFNGKPVRIGITKTNGVVTSVDYVDQFGTRYPATSVEDAIRSRFRIAFPAAAPKRPVSDDSE